MPGLPAARLAELAPTTWARTSRRMAVVRKFLARGDLSTRAMTRHAAEIGVSVPMFYKLVATWREWQLAGPAPRYTERRSARPQTIAIVRDAMALCGPGATQTEVFERAGRIAALRALDAPERSLVRREYLRRTAGPAAAERLGVEARWVLDASPLAVRVGGSEAILAVLTALVDMADGTIDAWTITPGWPTSEALERVALKLWGDALTTSLALPTAGPERSATDPPVRAGSALLAAIGGRMARVQLLPRADPSRPDARLPLVDIEDLRTVAAVSLPTRAAR